MRCIIAAVTTGCATAAFSGAGLHVLNGRSVTANPPFQCHGNGTRSSMTVQGTPGITVMDPWPTDDYAESYCCNLAGGVYRSGGFYTNVKYRPSSKHKDQWDYICTLYPDGKLVPGNKSTGAGFAPGPPPPPPPACSSQATLDDCLLLGGSTRNQVCAWYDNACHLEPPIECGSGSQTDPSEPMCINIILADHAFPKGAAGRKLGSFNWTSGTIAGKDEEVVKMPIQILKLGESNWWSISSGYLANGTAEPFKVCVQYNELLPDGTSDPDSWIGACLSGPGLLDALRGSSNKIGSSAGFGSQTFKGVGKSQLWAQFTFWSNQTVGEDLVI